MPFCGYVLFVVLRAWGCSLGVRLCGLAGRFGWSRSVLGIRGVSVPLSRGSACSPLGGCRTAAHCELSAVWMIGGIGIADCLAWLVAFGVASVSLCLSVAVAV